MQPRLMLLLLLTGASCTLLTSAFQVECGDGFLQRGEVCDDGNLESEDGCSATCALEEGLCGDNIVDPGESCDDGNTVSGDGCSNFCELEPGLCGDDVADSGEACDTSDLKSKTCVSQGFPEGGTLACLPNCSAFNTEGCFLCGDNIQEGPEACDDGNQSNFDACTNECIVAVCGDGIVNGAPIEECDDGNAVLGDGCNACLLEVPVSCGNGLANAGEDCDDGNQTNDDNCKNNCTLPIIVSVSAGGEHTCIVNEFKQVKCWGAGAGGRLGNANQNDLGDDELPSGQGTVSLGFGVTALSASSVHSCATNSSGELLCWGLGAGGRLGYGDTDNIGDDETPASVGIINLGANTVRQVATGGAHTCVILNNNNIQCWGSNSQGELGYGNTLVRGDNEPPFGLGSVDLNNGNGTVANMALGVAHTCVLLTNNDVRCWGRNGNGQLGYGTIDNIGDEAAETTQDTNVSLNGTPLQLAAGRDHTCALFNNGALTCWGLNDNGQLGLGNINPIGNDETPFATSVLTNGAVAQVAAGGNHTCALINNGTAVCWGANASGQLGKGDTSNFGNNTGETPNTLQPVNVGANVIIQITAGDAHTCALFTSGQIKCWGDGTLGRLGYGNTSNLLVPANNNVPVF